MCLCWFDELNLRVELLNWLFGNCSSSLYTVVSSFVNSISYNFLFFQFFLFIFFFHFFFTHFFIYIFFNFFFLSTFFFISPSFYHSSSFSHSLLFSLSPIIFLPILSPPPHLRHGMYCTTWKDCCVRHPHCDRTAMNVTSSAKEIKEGAPSFKIVEDGRCTNIKTD